MTIRQRGYSKVWLLAGVLMLVAGIIMFLGDGFSPVGDEAAGTIVPPEILECRGNRDGRIESHELPLLAGVVALLGGFMAVTAATQPSVTIETLLIRATALSAFAVLHVILAIGPLARLDRRFLPLLYNRRHLGVAMFLLALAHVVGPSLAPSATDLAVELVDGVRLNVSDELLFPSGSSTLNDTGKQLLARVAAQIVYYFYAAVALGTPARPVAFSVPTGNFGDIFAGYVAMRMGLPVERLLIATNRNDVLHRVMTQSTYGRQPLAHTLSPSMDITVSSNFERLLFDLLYLKYGGNILFSTSMDRADTAHKELFNHIRDNHLEGAKAQRLPEPIIGRVAHEAEGHTCAEDENKA